MRGEAMSEHLRGDAFVDPDALRGCLDHALKAAVDHMVSADDFGLPVERPLCHWISSKNVKAEAFREGEIAGIALHSIPDLISKTFPDNQIACVQTARALRNRPKKYSDMSRPCRPYNHLFGTKS